MYTCISNTPVSDHECVRLHVQYVYMWALFKSETEIHRQPCSYSSVHQLQYSLCASPTARGGRNFPLCASFFLHYPNDAAWFQLQVKCTTNIQEARQHFGEHRVNWYIPSR